MTGHQQAECARRGVGAGKLADDPPGEQHDDPVGEGKQLVEVLGDQQHAAAGVAHSAQLVVDVGVGADVEAAGRLGGDERPGVTGEGPGEEHLLQVAPGQPANGVVRLGADVEVGDQPSSVLADTAALRQAVAPEPVEVLEDEVLLDGQSGDDAAAAVLGDPPESGTDASDGIDGSDVHAVDVHAARRRCCGRAEHVDELGLAVAADAGNADDLARRHV